MSSARFLVGDVFDVMAGLPDGSVDLVLTSPPFLALRSYLPADHPDKGKEIGSEPTPAAFLDTLLALTAEWRRVLAPHGSICVELGDTYSGSGGAGGDYNVGGLRDGQEAFDGSSKRRRKANGHAVRDDAPRPPRDGRRHRAADEEAGILAPRGRPGPADRDDMPGWPLAKSLCGIPHLYHLSLAYGRNLLTSEPSPAGQWRVRNVVAWCRPNPPVGALGDKFRPGTSYMTVACVSGQRYFDLDAVRTPYSANTHARVAEGFDSKPRTGKSAGRGEGAGGARGASWDTLPERNNEGAGAPPLDWWEISTQPYKGSHYATWPTALCERPIKAMCPARVCVTCGEPSRRIVETTRITERDDSQRIKHANGERPAAGRMDRAPEVGWEMERTELGWTDCGHDNWRNGIVLDPFAGSGTTLVVASGHGRDCIGIDLDARNADLARERVGMFLEVNDDPAPRPVVDVPLTIDTKAG